MTYNKIEFENLINDILSKAGYDVDVTMWLLIDQNAKKWYDKKYTSNFEEITEDTVYALHYNGCIQFDIKVGKIDNLLKTFITQFSSRYKWLVEDENGHWNYKSDKIRVQKTIIEKNRDRVSKGLFYTTLYGIGFWAIFCTQQDIEIAKALHEFLKNNNIEYRNEWSDAGWVYRFVLKTSLEKANQLLTQFKAN